MNLRQSIGRLPRCFKQGSALLATLFVALLLASVGVAQVLYGTLVGRVEDPTGAVVAGAKVTVTNKDTGQQRETTTDESGAYAFRDLQAGSYELKVAQTGFKSYLKAGLNVTINNVAREDVRMEVGGAADS